MTLEILRTSAILLSSLFDSGSSGMRRGTGQRRIVPSNVFADQLLLPQIGLTIETKRNRSISELVFSNGLFATGIVKVSSSDHNENLSYSARLKFPFSNSFNFPFSNSGGLS